MDLSAARPETAAGSDDIPAIGTPDELALVIERDRRLAGVAVRGRGPGYVELGFAGGGLVFAWPEVWQDRARVAAHLLRARSGYSPLVLLGTDPEFAAAAVDVLRDQRDISPIPLP